MSVVRKKVTSSGGDFQLTDLDVDFACTASESVGDAVYISGNGTVSTADKSSITTAQVIGFIASKPTDTTCKVRTANLLSGLSGITYDKLYFLDASGAITDTPPTTGVLVRVGQGYNASSLLINIDNGYTILN